MVQVVHATIPTEGTEGGVGYAQWSEAHTVTDLDVASVDGLQAALDAKEPADATILKDADIGVSVAAASHEHAAADITSGTVATARLGSGTADGTTYLRGDQTWAAPDPYPWTIVALDEDFTTSNSTNTTVTGLAMTPAANTRYMIEGYFLLQTATTTVGARPGIAWPTGYSDGAAYTQAPNSATAIALQQGTPAAGTANAASTGLPVITRSYHSQMQAILIMGASPSGNFQITLASETAATNVTMKAGSLIRYRAY